MFLTSCQKCQWMSAQLLWHLRLCCFPECSIMWQLRLDAETWRSCLWMQCLRQWALCKMRVGHSYSRRNRWEFGADCASHADVFWRNVDPFCCNSERSSARHLRTARAAAWWEGREGCKQSRKSICQDTRDVLQLLLGQTFLIFFVCLIDFGIRGYWESLQAQICWWSGWFKLEATSRWLSHAGLFWSHRPAAELALL